MLKNDLHIEEAQSENTYCGAPVFDQIDAAIQLPSYLEQRDSATHVYLFSEERICPACEVMVDALHPTAEGHG